MNRLAQLTLAGVLAGGAALHAPAQSSAPAPAVQSRPTLAEPPVPPPAPAVRCPVDFFRELLAADMTELHKLLADRDPEARKLIMAKLNEYRAMSADERELRLQATELRYYLRPLLNMTGPDRTNRLARVPDRLRKSVEERLHTWDQLSLEDRQALLKNELTVRFLTELAASSPEKRTNVYTNLPPAAREQFENNLHQWQTLTEPQRQNVIKNFNGFFQLTDEERDNALRTLTDQERKQLEKTLQTYKELTVAQRAQCLRSFDKFARLSAPERQEFLKSAARWERMTKAEREAWNQLVYKIRWQPPSPETGPPLPIPPARLTPRVPQTPVAATN